MRAVRSVLAMLFAFVGVSVLFDSFTLYRKHTYTLTGPDGSFHPLLLASAAILPVAGTLFLIAAISYWRKWRSGRMWNLLLGLVNLVGPFFFAWFFWSHGYESFFKNLTMNTLLLGLGALILIAFMQWDPAADRRAQNPSVTAAQTGDGTISFLNRIYVFADAVLFFLIYDAWMLWALKAGLSRPGWMKGTLELILAAVLAAAWHELGHTLCGLAFRQKLLAFFAGPFQWRFHRGRWQFLFNPAGFLTTGGGTATVPQRTDEPEWRELCVVLAGPVASLIAGAAGLWIAFSLIGTQYESLWFPLAMFGSISLQAAVVNLIPLRTAAGYSDGARILQILRGGVWSDLDRVYRIASATLVTQLRPRNFDIDAIHRVLAAGVIPKRQQLHLHLLAKTYYLDHGATQEALTEILQAASLYDDCSTSIPATLHTSFILGEVLTRCYAAQARLWWDRMEAKKPTRFNGDYWMARCAVCWLERNRDESHAAWAKAHDYLATMPRTGAFEFDREILAALGRTIGVESAVEHLSVSSMDAPVLVV
ncbi:MAG: M50 family metallopeptidase [Silvibacterium sp.]|nr:M50 family metallopeptidase [Silvibacterium sp.]